MIQPSLEWKGTTALIAGSGPSQTKEDLDYACGKCRVVVLNSTWKIAPWADMLYACDRQWWHRYGPKPEQFQGMRVVGKGEWPGCLSVNCVPGSKAMVFDGRTIGGGWNSGFQALNLLALWKVARVILTGMDCQAEETAHWHGNYKDGVCQNPKQYHFDMWVKCFRQAAPVLKDRGVEVVNASRRTALDAFPRVDLREIL